MSTAHSLNSWPHVLASVLLMAAGTMQHAAADAPASDSAVERGKYLAIAGNCSSCHTTGQGEYMAGGVSFATPFGTLYSTNITSHPEKGIGSWTREQFRTSMRSGVRPNGEHLYPAFPYTSFTKVSDDDIDALYAYFQTVPPADWTPPENDMPFPFNQRALMGAWKALFFKEGAFTPDPKQSDEWNRGAYLVEGLAHCGACHTPRNMLGAEKSSQALSGGLYTDKIPDGDLMPWSAVNLTSAKSGLAKWTVDDLTSYLKTGKNSFIATYGPMNEVIMNSTRHLSEADVRAMSVYIKSLPPIEHKGSKASDKVLAHGEMLYTVYCGSCHLPTGLGDPNSGPPLVGSAVIQAPSPASLLNTLMFGPELPEPALETQWMTMEAFGEKMTDEEIAALASYLRSAWGNEGGAVSAKDVAAHR
ncbi:cytochrome c [Povalibacter sp.]|uniref:cytochrome c n=1 Tax=Povalibacter sp. TaxID=1962978 RepID=UPI002F3FD63D